MSGDPQAAAANLSLVRAIRDELARHADPDRAPQMQAYMKSKMPCRGVPAPVQGEIAKRVFAEHSLATFDEWRATVLELWHGAAYREERYLAIGLLGDRRYRGYRTLEALPLFEELIVSGAWWDLVDGIASHRLGELYRLDARTMSRAMLAWSRDPSLWKRRSAILSQITRRGETDFELLAACIEPNLDDREFFIRKAIGWALRSHARVDADAVLAYVRANEARLSGLSRREALKHVAAARLSP
ncbi:MAG: DNA alkylation repair protein [Gaiellaceae bacterium]